MGHILPSGIAEHQNGLAYVSSTLDASQCKHDRNKLATALRNAIIITNYEIESYFNRLQSTN